MGVLSVCLEKIKKREAGGGVGWGCGEGWGGTLGSWALKKKLRKNYNLQQSLTATDRNAAVLSPVAAVSHRLRKEFVGRHELIGLWIPCVWIMTIATTHGATLQKDNETDARSIDRTKGLCRMDARPRISIHPFQFASLIENLGL